MNWSSDARTRGRVLRSEDVGEVGPPAANLGVVSSHAARRIVVSGELMESARQEGYAAGFEEGYAAGYTHGLGDAQTHIQLLGQLVQKLANEADRLAARETTAREQIEDQVVATAVEIAETIVGRELEVVDGRGRDAIARALALAPERGFVTRAPPPGRHRGARRPRRPRPRPHARARSRSVALARRLHRRSERVPGRRTHRARARTAAGDHVVSALLDQVFEAARPRVQGRVTRIVGLNLEIDGLQLPIGAAVRVTGERGDVVAEVVAVEGEGLVCMPLGELRGVRAGDRAEAAQGSTSVPVGHQLLGRILDGLGRPIDGGAPLHHLPHVSVDHRAPHPLTRHMIDEALPLGVRALDTLMPCGRGQRMGIFAGSGVGKSTLLSMITRGTEAPITVLALVGERGREVREFIENDLGPAGLARAVVVVATSDEPALVRLRAAFTATRIAEFFRDEGQDVLLLMDSLTRFSMAQREVGLSAGEPPATRGYPPSVFAMLPRLLERAGASDRGSITGLYTVLVEGDDLLDPIGDASPRHPRRPHRALSRRSRPRVTSPRSTCSSRSPESAPR